MKQLLISFILALGACATLPGAPVVPARTPNLSKKVTLWGTHYYAHRAAVVTSGYPLYDVKGNPVSPKISQRDYCLCGIEGTCFIDGQVYDYKGSGYSKLVPFTCSYSGHTIRWAKGEFEFGKGNKHNPLEPFVSIAADQSIYKFGTLIYVPAAVGMKLPNGKTHDGYFRVDDVGSAIKGNHLDFFVGSGNSQEHFRFPFVKSSSARTFEAFVQ